METILEHPDAKIVVKRIKNGRNKITVNLNKVDTFMPYATWETAYPLPLIKQILNAKGPAWLCDEIRRDESQRYVQKSIHYSVFSYVDEKQFRNKRVLDFGCGSGASTMVLSRMLPETKIVGVELDPILLNICKLRCCHYRIEEKISLLLSPNQNSLPDNIGEFDYIFLNAVYEHLLPNERKKIMPLLWKHLKNKGVIFINQTPYRWFPLEMHTTSGLFFINYLPDYLAFYYARYFSKRHKIGDNWTTLLRKGIRGGSASEIINILVECSFKPILLSPVNFGFKDRIDIWYASSTKENYSSVKKTLFYFFKLIKMSLGKTVVPVLSLAILKD